jgi:NAD(P)-dependent dehydrogenase (short-subunit alcohol dehydrogenase family)
MSTAPVTDRKSLSGKVALITGGSRGIGAAVARRFAAAGSQVAIGYHVRGDAAVNLAAEIAGGGGQCLAVQGDITDADAVQRIATDTVARFGRIDILVNCAGIALSPKPLLDTTPEEFQRVFAVNLKGVWHCTQLAARDMIKRRSGRIINIASIAGKVPRIGLGAYCISKAAVIHLTRCLALELAPHRGITVNAVGPGPTRTNLRRNSSLPETPEQAKARQEQMLKGDAAQFRLGIPLGRIGEPEDQAAAVIFLASEEAGYISGQCLYVDGIAGES